MMGIKAGATLGSVLIINTIGKKHPRLALVTAIVANGLMSAVVANNMRQLR